MRINHNIAALNTYRQLTTNSANGQKSIEKLSSGLRINRAGDDAAGLAISEKMRGQIRGLDQASRNSQDGISLIQTAEGALNETHSILQRMRELAVQASNDTNSTDDRAELQKEIDQLTSEIDRIGDTTEFNTKKLLNGGAGLTTSFSAETVATADQNWISVVGGTADTKADNTDIVIADAKKATSATYSTTVTGVTAGTATIEINGYSISYTATTTAATNAENIASAINAVSDKIGVTANAGTDASGGAAASLDIISNDVGSASDLHVVSGANSILIAAVDSSTTGNDADIGSAQIADTDYIARGNTITVTSGDYKGLELQLNSAVMSDTNTENDATFKITGNGAISLQIGANEGQEMSISIGDMRAEALGVNTINVTTQSSASSAVTTIDNAIKSVSGERSKMGAYQNRLEHTINNLGTSSENLTAAESRVRDVDMAKEMMEFTKNNILNQAATAMLAQANQQPQGVLQLLR
ncbi:MAG: flagellin domain protein [Clostridiales bacterium]|nr:flagellin domain protein [Clostridiales bacterium]